MIEFLFLSANKPFMLSLMLMLAFTIIEVISVSLGMGLSDMIDSLIPEIDADIDIDTADMSGGPDSIAKILAWFRIGEVPVIMLFIVFLTSFGLAGLLVQYITFSVVATPLPGLIATAIAIVASIPTVRICGGILGKYMPKDETYVVSENTFPGMVATITLGTAAMGKPAEAKLQDKNGQTHYLLVEPDNPDESFKQGEKTIIVSQNGAIYKVIQATSSAMTD